MFHYIMGKKRYISAKLKLINFQLHSVKLFITFEGDFKILMKVIHQFTAQVILYSVRVTFVDSAEVIT